MISFDHLLVLLHFLALGLNCSLVIGVIIEAIRYSDAYKKCTEVVGERIFASDGGAQIFAVLMPVGLGHTFFYGLAAQDGVPIFIIIIYLLGCTAAAYGTAAQPFVKAQKEALRNQARYAAQDRARSTSGAHDDTGEFDYSGWTHQGSDSAQDGRKKQKAKANEAQPDIDFSEMIQRAHERIKNVSDAQAGNTATRLEKMAAKEKDVYQRELYKMGAALLKERAKGYAGREKPAPSEAEIRKMLINAPADT